MTKIYSVIAHTGEHADRSAAIIMSYTRKQSATAHAKRANAYAKAHGLNKGGANVHDWEMIQEVMENNPYHPHGHVQYTGIHYTVSQQPISESLSEGLHRIKN